MSELSLSVVLPTYNRADILPRTLRAYADQDGVPERYEIIVVDDGSTDGTQALLDSLSRDLGGRLKVFRQKNAGPGAARNRAIREAKGDIILFAGDDVVPDPRMAAIHLRQHSVQRDHPLGILGKISWAREMQLTPFMYWLEHGGPQFAFGSVADGEEIPPTMFYTSNLSVPRAFMLQHGMFDEQFRAAGWEDVDLGIRLHASGLRLVYAAEARGEHHHQTDFSSYVRRVDRIGYYHAMLIHKHGLAPDTRRTLTEALKLALGSIFRWIPYRPLRHLGYRWSLSWREFRSMRRYNVESTHRA